MHTTRLLETVRRGIDAEARFNDLAAGTDAEVDARHDELSALAQASRAAVLAAADIAATSDEQRLAKARLLAAVTRDDGSEAYALARSLLRDLGGQSQFSA